MIRSTLFALGLLGFLSSSAFASPVPLGALSNYAVFSPSGQIFNNNYFAGTTTINDGQDAGSQFALSGSTNITFNGGGSFQTIAFNGTEYQDFFTLTSTLSAVSGTFISSWVGLTPGNYTFDAAPTSVTLTGPGSYIFKYIGSDATLAFNNVNITLGSGMSSDDVMWYVPKDVSIVNSAFAGILVVDGFGAHIEANGSPTNFQGRVLAQTNADLLGWNAGGDLSFNNVAADPGPGVPEPASIVLVFSALAVGAIVRHRQSTR